MISEIDKYLGIENLYTGGSEELQNNIIGGYAANYSVGGTAVYKIRSNIMDWKLMPKQSSQQKKIATVNDILNLGKFIENETTLCIIIKEIYNLSDQELIKALSKSLELTESLDIAFRKLYYVWMDLIEFTLYSLIEVEEIDSPFIDDDKSNNSILAQLKDFELGDSKLMKKIQMYNHQGYCPCEPIKRINNLFTFPINDIIKYIKQIDPTFMIGVDLNEIYEKMIDIIKQVEIENKKSIAPIKERKPLPSKMELNTYVEAFIELYRTSLPALKQQEKKYISLSRHVIKICTLIENIIISSD